jgi:hypothetical protein
MFSGITTCPFEDIFVVDTLAILTSMDIFESYW